MAEPRENDSIPQSTGKPSGESPYETAADWMTPDQKKAAAQGLMNQQKQEEAAARNKPEIPAPKNKPAAPAPENKPETSGSQNVADQMQQGMDQGNDQEFENQLNDQIGNDEEFEPSF